MPELPADYHGREQTWLKHRVLTEYLTAWAHKLGSVAGHEVHLWYVDVFAGPWESQAADLADTSIAIGLRALNVAASTWVKAGRLIHLHAVFVGKSRPFERHRYLPNCKARWTILRTASGSTWPTERCPLA